MSEKLFGYGNDDQIRSRKSGACTKGDESCRGKELNSCWPCMMKANEVSHKAGQCVHLIRDEPACGPWGTPQCAICRHRKIKEDALAARMTVKKREHDGMIAS